LLDRAKDGEQDVATPKIAINGFGRIGRTVIRIAKLRGHFNVVAVNDLVEPEQIRYAFKYDSVYGTYPGEVALEGDTMVIDGDTFKVLSESDPSNLPWRELGVDYVIESTGKFRQLQDLQQHLDAGAKRVLVTVPTKDYLESTLVMGVNDHVVKQDSTIISNASCTTNCAAPIAKVLQDNFGIKRGLLTTVHAYTSDQRLTDSPHSGDMRRSRNAATNIIPTSTGAAKAIGKVLPELAGKLDGMAMRVPVPDGSLVDLTAELATDVVVDGINEAMQRAAGSDLKGILEYCEDPIVSSDIVGNSHSSIFDAALTQVIEKRLIKVVSWYDNEWGYSSRISDLISRLAGMDNMSVS
jgi:glyceraldehyde 3-phosphate dehydrogenase|tara:strand:+ start:1987 stop:3045 length:1059 start_codon:yes stop_codon:yes gene_type:complete